MSGDLQRIIGDLAHAQKRLADCMSGTRGQPTADAHHVAPGRALEGQTNAARNDIARLEREYLDAMLAERKWQVSEIVRRMSMPSYTGPTIERVHEPATDAAVIAKMREFLSKVPDNATVESLKELVA